MTAWPLLTLAAALWGGESALPDLSEIQDQAGRMAFVGKQYWNVRLRTMSAEGASRDLRKKIFSPQGIAEVRRMFEQAIQESVVVEGKLLVVPELGGYAESGAGVTLHNQRTAVYEARCALIQRLGSPERILDLYAEYPDQMKLLDPGEIMRKSLSRLPLDPAMRGRVLRDIPPNIIFTGSTQYFPPSAGYQRMLEENEWKGRYLGFWHAHMPGSGPDGWTAGGAPAGHDLAAARDGLEFVLSFDPDGFDLYDLFAAVGKDAASVPAPIRYRSAGWRERFQAMHSVLLAPAFESARRAACR